MRTVFHLGLWIAVIVTACNNPGEHDTLAVDTASKSNPAMQGEQPPPAQDSFPKAASEIELNRFDGMSKDSIKVTYGLVTDHLYGYKQTDPHDPAKDVLHVEGDILVDYPVTGVKGVGTNAKIWPLKFNQANHKTEITVPFVIDTGYKFADRVRAAMKLWSDSLNVRFVDKGALDLDYVEFFKCATTQSYVGRRGNGMQPVGLADWAMPGNIAHEIGHALGLYHEMARSDRDKFVHVICTYDVNYQHAFLKDPYARDLGQYDFFSIMHYAPSTCMQVLKPGLPYGIPGQRERPSHGDLISVKQIYKLK